MRQVEAESVLRRALILCHLCTLTEDKVKLAVCPRFKRKCPRFKRNQNAVKSRTSVEEYRHEIRDSSAARQRDGRFRPASMPPPSVRRPFSAQPGTNG